MAILGWTVRDSSLRQISIHRSEYLARVACIRANKRAGGHNIYAEHSSGKRSGPYPLSQPIGRGPQPARDRVQRQTAK